MAENLVCAKCGEGFTTGLRDRSLCDSCIISSVTQEEQREHEERMAAKKKKREAN